MLDGYHGILVRDDYNGWAQFDAQLAGVQQCCQHIARHLKGVHALHTDWQHWAEEVRQILGEAHRAVAEAIAAGRTQLDPGLLTDLRERYDSAVHWGEITNRLRDWDDGKNHPGYVLARRLKAKADQIWLFTRNFAVPWTKQPSEQAIKGPNGTRPSPGTGTLWLPWPATAACAPTWSPAVTTASGPSTPSTLPSPATPGYQLQSAPDTAASVR